MSLARKIVLRVIRLVRTLIYRCVFAFCVARGKPLVVFEVDAVGLREHSDPVVHWLLDDGACTVVVAVTDSEFEVYKRKGVPSGAWCIPKSQFGCLGQFPSVIVSFHPEHGSDIARAFASSKAQRIVMQHGLSDKAVFSDRERPDPLSDFDAVFLVGPVFRGGSLRTYCEKYAETCSRLRFIEVGLPKTDALFYGDHNRELVLRGLGLDPKLPTICYAPTWEKVASLEQHGIAIIETLADLPVNLIVKLHHASLCAIPYDWILQDGHGGRDWAKIMKEIEGRRPNVRLANGQDATPYLIASDLLVSDASGIAYEFVLLDRPVVFFDVPSLFATYGRDGIHFWGRECGVVAVDTASLRNIVEHNLRSPEYRRSERLKWIPQISYSRGDATEKAGRAILDLMGTPRA